MGTNELGIDTFAQVLRGAQKSCLIALSTAVLSTIIGAVLGAIAGYYRGWIDSLIMRLTDLFLVFPIVAIAGAIAYKFAVGSSNGWIAIAVILAVLSVDLHLPHRARRVPLVAGEGVRGRGAGARGDRQPDHLPPPHAERGRAGDRQRHLDRVAGHPDRDHPVLHRPRASRSPTPPSAC